MDDPWCVNQLHDVTCYIISSISLFVVNILVGLDVEHCFSDALLLLAAAAAAAKKNYRRVVVVFVPPCTPNLYGRHRGHTSQVSSCTSSLSGHQPIKSMLKKIFTHDLEQFVLYFHPNFEWQYGTNMKKKLSYLVYISTFISALKKSDSNHFFFFFVDSRF